MTCVKRAEHSPHSANIGEIVGLIGVGLFFAQLYILPARYYLFFVSLALPWTHNIPLLLVLGGLGASQYFARPDSGNHSYIRLLALSIASLFGAQLLCWYIGSSRYSTSDSAVFSAFASFYGPMTAIFCGYIFARDTASLYRLVQVVGAVCMFSIACSWLFVISDTVFGYVMVRDGARTYMYRLMLPRLTPTGLGILCGVAAPLQFGLYLQTVKRSHLYLSIFAIVSLIFTLSRWNIVVGLAIIGLQLFFSRGKILAIVRKEWLVVGSGVLALLGIVIYFLTSGWFDIMIGKGVLDREDSVSTRTEAIRNGLRLFTEKPIFGYGPGEVYYRLVTAMADGGDTTYGTNVFFNGYGSPLEMPHSIWVEILAEGGLTAGFAFAGLWLTITLSCYKIVRSQKSAVSSGAAFACLVYILTGFFSSFDNIIETWVSMWFIVGIVYSAMRIDNNPNLATLRSKR